MSQIDYSVFNSVTAESMFDLLWDKDKEENDKQLFDILVKIVEKVNQTPRVNPINTKYENYPAVKVVITKINHLVLAKLEQKGFNIEILDVLSDAPILYIKFSKIY